MMKNVDYDDLPRLFDNGKKSGNDNFSVIKNNRDVDLVAWINKPYSMEVRVAYSGKNNAYAHDTMTGEKIDTGDALKWIKINHPENFKKFEQLKKKNYNKGKELSMGM